MAGIQGDPGLLLPVVGPAQLSHSHETVVFLKVKQCWLHAFGSTGGTEDQVSWHGKATGLVATAATVGSDAREAVKGKVSWPLDRALGASSIAWRTTWSVLAEASFFPSQLSIPVGKGCPFPFPCPSLQDLQRSGQTRTKAVL